jgi:hypothetical protein
LLVTSEGVDHEQLGASAIQLVDAVGSLRQRLISEGSAYMQHYDCADRARQLASHLRGALALSELHLYPSAFSVIRTAFEHHVFDRLLFLARWLVHVVEGVDGDEFARMQSQVASGENGIESVEWLGKPAKGKVRVVRRGVPVTPAGATEPEYDLSVYHAVIEHHMPLVGRPSDQEFLDDGLSTVEERTELAHRQRELYRRYLRWESLKQALLVNKLADQTKLLQLEVHYRFLSTFTHAAQSGYRLVRAETANPHDHYAEELVWLYVVEFAASEIEDFLEMSALKPSFGVQDAPGLTRLVQRCRQHAAHLWFAGGSPHPYDYFEEANRRGFRQVRDRGSSLPPPVRPEELGPEEVGYYSDPMRRLMRLHWTTAEIITGLAYRSPWPRADASVPR